MHSATPLLPPQLVLLGGKPIAVAVTEDALHDLLPMLCRVGSSFGRGAVRDETVADLVSILVRASGRPLREIEQWSVSAGEFHELLSHIGLAALQSGDPALRRLGVVLHRGSAVAA